MRTINVIFDKNPFYIFVKRHYCINCGCKLKPVHMARSLLKEDTQGDEYRGLKHAYGEIEKVNFIFKCSNCNEIISPNEMYEHEKKRLK